MTEKTKPLTGHADDGSSIQKHSTGDHYPWSHVVKGDGKTMRIVPTNLTTGKELDHHEIGDDFHAAHQAATKAIESHLSSGKAKNSKNFTRYSRSRAAALTNRQFAESLIH